MQQQIDSFYDFDPSLDYTIEHYKLLQPIGCGASAVIFEAVDVFTDEPVCCKIIPKSTNQIEIENVITEVKILNSLDHKNIVKFYDFFEDEENFYLIEELCKGVTLLQYINEKFENYESLSNFEIKSITFQLLNVLAYLQSKGIAHRDIKPENIIVHEKKDTSNGKNLEIKLIDFGLATTDGNDYSDTFCGSIHYIAPEIIVNSKYVACPCDVWSAGVIFFILIADRLPFESEDMDNLIHKIVSGDYVLPLQIDQDAARLVSRLLAPNPEERISAAEAIKDSFFKPLNHVQFQMVHQFIKQNPLCAKQYSLSKIFMTQPWKKRNSYNCINNHSTFNPNIANNKIRRSQNPKKSPIMLVNHCGSMAHIPLITRPNPLVNLASGQRIHI